MIDAAFPLWSERTGRDFNYFARRFPSDGSLYLALEDSAGTIGVALPTLAEDVVVLDTEFVAPSADSPTARAMVANAISAAALAMNATGLAVPAGSQLAETYEEIGFAPTLFLQFDGARSRYWRQQAIDRFDDLRLLEGRDERDLGGGSGQPLDPDGSVIFRRPRYVVTHYPRFRKPALSEVQQVDPRAEVTSADSARTIVSGATPGCGLTAAFRARHPTFVQHLAPVRARVRLAGDAGDLGRIRSAVDRTESTGWIHVARSPCSAARRTARSPARMARHRTARET